MSTQTQHTETPWELCSESPDETLIVAMTNDSRFFISVAQCHDTAFLTDPQPELAKIAAFRLCLKRTKYPYPEDCETCTKQMPCNAHKHLAEPDPDRGHKERGL